MPAWRSFPLRARLRERFGGIPVRVHNDLSPAVQTLEWVPSQEDQARLDAGRAFEVAVFMQLMALNPGCVVVDPDPAMGGRIYVATGNGRFEPGRDAQSEAGAGERQP